MASELSSLIDKQLRSYEDVESGKGSYSKASSRSSHSSETILKTFARQRRMLLAALVSLTIAMAMYTAFAGFGSVQPKEIVLVGTVLGVHRGVHTRWGRSHLVAPTTEAGEGGTSVQVTDLVLEVADGQAELREEAFEMQQEQIEVEEARLEQQAQNIDATLQAEEEMAREVAEAEAEVIDTLEAELAGADVEAETTNAASHAKDAEEAAVIDSVEEAAMEEAAMEEAAIEEEEAILEGEVRVERAVCGSPPLGAVVVVGIAQPSTPQVTTSDVEVVEISEKAADEEESLLQADLQAEAAIEEAIESENEALIEEIAAEEAAEQAAEEGVEGTSLDAMEEKIIGEDRPAINEPQVETALDQLLDEEATEDVLVEQDIVEDANAADANPVDESLEEALVEAEGGL